MAVEARHLNLFPSQLIQDRSEMVNQCNQGNTGIPQQMRFPAIQVVNGTLPGNYCYYGQPAVCDSLPAKTSVNTDSGLTYNVPVATAPPRKRSRDTMNQNQLYVPPQNYGATTHKNINNNNISQFSSFIGEDLLPQIHQHHLEIDAIISQHTKKIRLELEERQKQQSRLLAAAIGEGISKKLKEKDEQIQRMNKLNLVLQERVKSLFVENQLWRDLAQSNEATANSLRSNLEQVLAHVGTEERFSTGVLPVEDDVESCCGSSDTGAGEEEKEVEKSISYSDKRCKRCGERESCVLLLPCRHLCLCSVCGSGSHQLQACPVCNSSMNATLHVNMS